MASAVKPKHVFGWWDWDAETPAMVNRVTGERVAFRGVFQDPDLVAFDESWLRFDYEHPELSFPLLVEERQAEKPREKGKVVWRIDYSQSHDLLKREGGGSDLRPSYGVWRRVDDCVVDALACWPQDNSVAQKAVSLLRLEGGWLNGVWSKKMHRTETCLVRPTELQLDDEDYNSWLLPLDALPPSPFEFHDVVPRRIGRENWRIGNPVLLDGLEFDDAERGFGPKLPPNVNLTGLEGRTVYLLSRDNQRLLYPYYGDTELKSGSGHWQSWFKMLYVDELAVMSSSARPTKRSSQGAMWQFSLFGKGLGLRSTNADAAFFVRSREVFAPIPSRPLWLKVRWGVADGWSSWDGSHARNPDWLKDLSLVRADGLTLSEGYRGGRWVARVSTSIRKVSGQRLQEPF